MTWKTPLGERVLNKAEAQLFANAVGVILDYYKSWPAGGLNWGRPVTEGPFEELPTPQKLAVLEEVAEALLTETPVPAHSSITENAIYYVYRWILEQIESDVTEQEEIWGQDVLDALGRCGRDPDTREEGAEGMDRDDSEDEDSKYDPYIGCRDVEKWEAAIEELADRILWDRDWELGEYVAQSSGMMDFMKIDPNYFSYVVPTDKCRGAADRLEALCRLHCSG
eukprot:jgi/Botrbrau1/21940/Bobra.0249s0063.1